MLGGDGIGNQCRTTDIMADAAYAVLSQPKDYTGQFLVDEDVLKKEGIRDFDPYAVQKGRGTRLFEPVPGGTHRVCQWSPGHPLLPDFFLDEAPDYLAEKMEEHGKRNLWCTALKWVNIDTVTHAPVLCAMSCQGQHQPLSCRPQLLPPPPPVDQSKAHLKSSRASLMRML